LADAAKDIGEQLMWKYDLDHLKGLVAALIAF
jgi:hypothetical protein